MTLFEVLVIRAKER